jgi:hypothetical protein
MSSKEWISLPYFLEKSELNPKDSNLQKELIIIHLNLLIDGVEFWKQKSSSKKGVFGQEG